MITHNVSPCWHWGHPNEEDTASRNLETTKKRSDVWHCGVNSEFQLQDISLQNGEMENEKDHDLDMAGAARECPRASEEAEKGEFLGIFMEGARFKLGLRNSRICG